VVQSVGQVRGRQKRWPHIGGREESVVMPTRRHASWFFARRAFFLAILLVASFAAPLSARADADSSYPNRTIKIVVGFAAGGGNDIIARIVAQKLQDALGQAVIVENRPGAGGRLSAAYVATAPADGYTLLVGASGAMAIAPAVYEKMSYDTLKDFAPISMIASFPLILVVHPSNPAKNLQDLIAWAKSNPDKTNYATSSTAFTLATELLKLRTGAPMTPIPYKSSGESLLSVIAQQSLLTIADPPPTTPQVKSGQLRALAVTAKTRLPELPDVPTMAEAGVAGVDVELWSGMFAPVGTPPAIVKKLETEFQRMMRLPDVQEKFRQMATTTVGSNAEDFTRTITAEIKMWTDVARQANVKFEE
jgi:tripartite-type tricarboxylate transporter receptor subunit TctC